MTTAQAATKSDNHATSPVKNQPFTEPVPLTRPPLLIALTLAVALLSIGFYAVATAKVTTQIDGTGVMLSGGFASPVVATQAGQVTSVAVAPGDQVTTGQEVGQLFVGNAIVPAVSPLSGQVLQLEARVGEVVEAGEPLLLIIDPNQPLVVTVPIPADQAMSLRTGQQVRVLPANASNNDPGFVIGEVAGVQALPSGTTRERQDSATDSSSPTPSTQPTRELTVTFADNPTSADQLQWQGTQPDPSPFGQGAIVRVEVITGEQSVLSVLSRSRS